MRTTSMTVFCEALIALAIGTSSVCAQQAAPPTPLTEVGQKLEARYADQLNQLRTELTAKIPPREQVKADNKAAIKADGKADPVEKLLVGDPLEARSAKANQVSRPRSLQTSNPRRKSNRMSWRNSWPATRWMPS